MKNRSMILLLSLGTSCVICSETTLETVQLQNKSEFARGLEISSQNPLFNPNTIEDDMNSFQGTEVSEFQHTQFESLESQKYIQAAVVAQSKIATKPKQ